MLQMENTPDNEKFIHQYVKMIRGAEESFRDNIKTIVEHALPPIIESSNTEIFQDRRFIWKGLALYIYFDSANPDIMILYHGKIINAFRALYRDGVEEALPKDKETMQKWVKNIEGKLHSFCATELMGSGDKPSYAALYDSNVQFFPEAEKMIWGTGSIDEIEDLYYDRKPKEVGV